MQWHWLSVVENPVNLIYYTISVCQYFVEEKNNMWLELENYWKKKKITWDPWPRGPAMWKLVINVQIFASLCQRAAWPTFSVLLANTQTVATETTDATVSNTYPLLLWWDKAFKQMPPRI